MGTGEKARSWGSAGAVTGHPELPESPGGNPRPRASFPVSRQRGSQPRVAGVPQQGDERAATVVLVWQRDVIQAPETRGATVVIRGPHDSGKGGGLAARHPASRRTREDVGRRREAVGGSGTPCLAGDSPRPGRYTCSCGLGPAGGLCAAGRGSFLPGPEGSARTACCKQG